MRGKSANLITTPINEAELLKTHSHQLESLAPAVFVLLWSTGFIGAKFGLPYAEPMTFLSLRFIIVAVLLGIILLIFRAPLPRNADQWMHLSVVGILVHAGYLGGVFAAIWLGLNAGIAALIVGMQPILTAVLVGPLLGEQVTRTQWLGFILGFIGVTMVCSLNITWTNQGKLALLLCLLGLLAITAGTVYQKRFCTDIDLRSGSFIQFIAAAVVTGVLALIFETRQITWHPEFIFALLWLCLVLSLGAISLLLYLIRHGEASRVASLFYLVPPVVAVEAWFLFNERLSVVAILGMIIAIVGVALVLQKRPAE